MIETPWHGPDVHAVPDDRAFAARRDRLVLLGMLALEYVLAFFCMVWRCHYSVDSYRVLVDMAPVWHLSLGRYTNYTLISLAQMLRRNVVHDQRILMLVWIAALVVATYLVTELFCRLWREGSGEEPSLPARLLMGAAASLCWLSVFNVVLVKVLIALRVVVDSGRGASLSPQHVLENVRGLAEYQPALLWNADGLMLPLFLTLFVVVLAVLVVRMLVRLGGRAEVLFCVIAIVSYAAAFAPHLVESSQLLTPRSNVSFWAFLASIALIVVMAWALGRSTKGERRAFVGVLAAILLISGLTIQDVAQDNYISNEADRMTAAAIADRIEGDTAYLALY